MRKNTVLKRLACFCLAAVLAFGIQPPAKASAKGGYPEVDAFKNSLTSSRETYKGVQGAGYRNQFYNDPISHTVWNCFMNEYIGSGEEYTYKGTTYHFSFPLGVEGIRTLNNQNVTVSVVFLMKYDANKTYLIAEEARTPGYKYYAPAYAEGSEGAKTLDAFWHYIMETCAKNNIHIDNFILGNEVNMPNHWHYSGTLAVASAAGMYAAAFATMRAAVEEYSTTARCSISLDHSWQHNDEGRGIAAKDYLDMFATYLGKDSNWCISYHMYPSVLIWPQFWQKYSGMDLNPVSADARFVDGRNLTIMTNYVKNTYGEKHRIMMTEEGFSNYYGEAIQAASLAYSYLAAKYDPMVDCFILHIDNEGGMQNFSLSATAQNVWKALDGPSKNQSVVDQCLGTIGVGSWSTIIPNYGAEPVRTNPEGFLLDSDGKYRIYKKDGKVDTSYTGWYNDGGQLYLMKEGVQLTLKDEKSVGDIPVRDKDNLSGGFRLNGGYTGWYYDKSVGINSYLWADDWKDETASNWANYGKNEPAKNKAVYDSRTDKYYVVNGAGRVVFGEYDFRGKKYKTDEKTGVYEGMSGLALDDDGVRRYYSGLSVDSGYNGWYVDVYEENGKEVEKMYLLKAGEEQNLPSKSEVRSGWYRDGDKCYWMDEDGTQAKNKKIYDKLTDGWYVLKANGDVVLGGYDIDGVFYGCSSDGRGRLEKEITISGRNLDWLEGGGKRYWYEEGVRQGTYDDPKGVVGDNTVRGREICDNKILDEYQHGTWFWLDSIYDGAKACNKEVWIPYIFQDEDTYDEARKNEQAGLSGPMAQQVKKAINEKSGKWVRYDADGRMCKGWYKVEGDQAKIYPNQAGNTYYYDPITGLMAKGTVTIDGKSYTFDEITGVLRK